MELEDTPGQRLGVYVAEPGTPDYDGMLLLDMTAAVHTEKSARPTALNRTDRGARICQPDNIQGGT
jgi:hypothetical protein